MATINENLEALKTAKTSIKSAIEGKGQDLTNVPFTQYGEKIANIKTEPNLATKSITANGTYNASDDGVDGYSSVDVNVSSGGEYPTIELLNVVSDYITEAKLSNAKKLPNFLFANQSTSNGAWTKLKTIDIGNITSILFGAFKNCGKLENITLPNSLTYVGSQSFYNCSSLALTSLPDSVTTIDDNAFYGCTKLALTALPSKIIIIPNSLFYGCTSLNLSLHEGITSIGNNAFQSCTNLELTSLPSTVKTLGENTFALCTNLALASLPAGLTDLGYQASFNKCPNITISSIPAGVKRIGYQTFNECTGLTTMTFEGAITEVGQYAFKGCANMTKFSFPANDKPPTLANVNAIPTQAITIEVKNGTLSAWQGATNWSALSNVTWVELPA